MHNFAALANKAILIKWCHNIPGELLGYVEIGQLQCGLKRYLKHLNAQTATCPKHSSFDHYKNIKLQSDYSCFEGTSLVTFEIQSTVQSSDLHIQSIARAGPWLPYIRGMFKVYKPSRTFRSQDSSSLVVPMFVLWCLGIEASYMLHLLCGMIFQFTLGVK